MQVVDVHRIVNRVAAKLVGGSMGHPPADTAASQPHRESVWMMVAAVGSTLASWSAAKFTSPDHEGVIEKPACLKIPEQSGDRQISCGCILFVTGFQIAVLVRG